jgi:putative dehydrogenase
MQLRAREAAKSHMLGAMGAGIAQPAPQGLQVHVCDVRPGVAAAFAKEGGVACTSRRPKSRGLRRRHQRGGERAADRKRAVRRRRRGRGDEARQRVRDVFHRGSELVDRARARLNERGIHYIDAPISGGAAKAASGEMTVMSAAKARGLCGSGRVLDAMAGKVYRLGDSAGAGSKVKIINQLLAGVHIAAAAEAMALGLREGVDPMRCTR